MAQVLSTSFSQAEQTSLVETFNASASDYAAERLPASLLVQKYNALLKYKAQDEETKMSLADALFKAAERYLWNFASPEGKAHPGNQISGIEPVMKALAAPESAPYIPARAPSVLADIAIALADRVGNFHNGDAKRFNLYEGSISDFRNNSAALGVFVMEYAEKFNETLSTKSKTTIKPTGPGKLSQ